MKVILLAVFLGTLAISSAEILKLAEGAEAIPGEYVILLKDGVDSNRFIRRTALRRNNGELSTLENKVMNVWNSEITGFAAKLDEAEAQQLDASDEVKSIGPNQIFHIAATVTQQGADWGLARLSRKLAVGSSPYSYTYDDSAGTGSTVYVVDTGVYIAHNEFEGRATYGANYVTGEADVDLNGHGTHCAGTVAGRVYGVAKKARIVGVKVLGASGSGTLAAVISGVNFVVTNSTGNRARSFISMSLGASSNTQVDNAVLTAVAQGVSTIVAAGNSGANACNYSPAAAATAITVGATNSADQITSWSNHGTCVQVLAPGNLITSAWIGGVNAVNTISGTSMATPQVAGLCAYLAPKENLNTPAAVTARIAALSVKNAVTTLPSGTPNQITQNELSA